MADSTTKDIIVWGGAAVLLWYLYEQGYLASWTGLTALAPTPTSTVSTTTTAPVTTTTSSPSLPTPPTTTPAAPTPPATPTPAASLTVADAATYPYSSAVTAAQMNSINAQLQTELGAGQIPTINGDSVLAYMLGWGGAAGGASKTVLGDTYTFDGTNWNLQSSAALAGLGRFGNRVPAKAIHTRGQYRFVN
jgi:hypothetical protein